MDELLAQGLIEQEGARYPTIRLTEQGLEVLTGKHGVRGIRREETRPRQERRRPPAPATETGTYDPLLFERLRSVRMSLARKQSIPPYIIFSDRTLREMACRRPLTPEAMRRIHGVGDRKLERHGNSFTEEIEAHLEETGRDADKTRPAATRSRRTKMP